MIQDTMNPFDTRLDPDHLYNIGTGKSTSVDTERFLLAVATIGEARRRQFIQECIENPSRFEKRIPRQKVHTFSSDAGKCKLRGTDGKLVAACLVRDLFGSILYHSLEQKVDMAEVLKYPLTPVPLSLSHVDGTMQKTPKSVLMTHLESLVTTSDPTSINTTIIDASFFLHLQSNSALPSTFGMLSRFLLQRVLSSDGDTIHFVTDKWLSPSIKDCERDSRASSGSAAYQITGPAQKRPTNWFQALRNPTFKESLIEFLIQSWEDDSLTTIYQNKVLYANSGDVCYRYSVVDGSVQRCVEESLCCDHEEADSRMFYHVVNAPVRSNIVIRTSDTDCLIIALGCFPQFHTSLKVWIEAGLTSNNTRRYISINQIHQKLGTAMCKSLPAYHAFTGCDYTASFSRKGKVRPLKQLQKNEEAQSAFIQLAHETSINTTTIETLEKFTCEMYGRKKLSSVDEVRFHMFLDKYKPKKGDQRISCVQKLDGSALPPCSRSLLQKIRRTHLISRRWISATSSFQCTLSPLEYGWKEEDDHYQLMWFEGQTSPTPVDLARLEKDHAQANMEDPDIVEDVGESDSDDESSDSEDSSDSDSSDDDE